MTFHLLKYIYVDICSENHSAWKMNLYLLLAKFYFFPKFLAKIIAILKSMAP